MRILSLLFAVAMIVSCGQGQGTKGETNTNVVNPDVYHGMDVELVKEGTTNKVLLSDIQQSLEGKVEVYEDGNAYIVKNWETKSAMSFEVLGDKKAELVKLNGKIVVAKGKVTKTGAYSGTIQVESYTVK